MKTQGKQPFKRRRIRTIQCVSALLFGVSALTPAAARSADCPGCRQLLTAYQNFGASVTELTELLQKNRLALGNLSPEQTGMAVKIKSNLALIQIRISAAQNNRQAIASNLEEKGCKACDQISWDTK